jgi:hypothetical protein
MITRDPSLGRRVKSVLISNINDDDVAALRESINLFLSHALNIQRFAIPGRPNLLPELKRPLLSGDLPLQCLRTFQCMNCGPEIWEIIPHLPRLSRLALKNYSCGPSTLHLQASSLPIEHILLEGCNLGSEAICVMIRSCKCLVSF